MINSKNWKNSCKGKLKISFQDNATIYKRKNDHKGNSKNSNKN